MILDLDFGFWIVKVMVIDPNLTYSGNPESKTQNLGVFLPSYPLHNIGRR